MSVDCVSQLGFRRPLTSLVKESLVVRNPNSRPVAFKVKTTAPKQYCVRPNSGRIEPGQEIEVQVLLQAMKEDPPSEYKCRDKFLVQSTIISPEHESSSISVLWSAIETKNRDDIHEKKIRCVFLPAEGSAAYRVGQESFDANNSTYHVSESSVSDHPQFDTAQRTRTVAEPSELFHIEPALSSFTSTAKQDSSVSDTQLDEANQTIQNLREELRAATKSKSRDSQTGVHNEGVPVPITALIALIAFMAAYLLF